MGTRPSTSTSVVLDDLKAIFGGRLEAFVTYAPMVAPAPSLALVTTLDLADLTACAGNTRRWQQHGAATPVLLTRREFARSLDAFPVEFGEIIAHHVTLHGDDPFAGMRVAPRDLRRACEAQVRSLLLHIREDFMEAGGAPRAVAEVVVDSAADFRALLNLVARLDGAAGDQPHLTDWASSRLGLDARVVADVLLIANAVGKSSVDAARLFPQYLAATEHLARHIDEWPDE